MGPDVKNNKEFSLSCPIPIKDYPQVLLAHGGGGKLMHNLIEQMFYGTFGSQELNKAHDAAILNCGSNQLAFTTDSYVVNPLFFPGGNIGSLAVHGTVNDLAMAGARPLYLSLAFILEEGLDMQVLWEIVQHIKEAADRAHVQVVTGDTKVVDRGKGDGIFINTAGIGVIEHNQHIAPQNIQAGDCILINGDIGRHGMSIMAVRDGLSFESTIESDSAALNDLVLDLIKQGIKVHCLRDLTRGGLASALNELTENAGKAMIIDESCIPVKDDVAAACEILGLEPAYVANEGRFIAFVPAEDKQKALDILQAHPLGEGACCIGQVSEEEDSIVYIKSVIGTLRILDMLSGEQLPRIC